MSRRTIARNVQRLQQAMAKACACAHAGKRWHSVKRMQTPGSRNRLENA